MGKSLSELGLKDEKLPGGTMEDLPEYGGFADPPQPGPYRFKMPGDLSKVWDVFDAQKGQRVRMQFDRDNALLIVQSPGGKANGETFQVGLSNLERPRGKEKIEVSDLDYLLKALGEKVRPTSNKGYIDLIVKHAGAEFGGDITYSFQCRADKPVRAMQDDGTVQVVESQMGCGKRLYQKDITGFRDAEGKYPTQIQCPDCGAMLRTFGNLENIRA